jgi:putative hemolysin
MTGLQGFHELPAGDFVTLAGFVLAQLGHIPKAGDQFTWSGWRFRVVEMDARRIDKVVIEPIG